MKRRSFKLFQSIYFKIPLLFLFVLLIAFQFIGVFFMDRLEAQSVASFKNQINTQGEFLANNLSPLLTNETLSEEELSLRYRQTLETFTANNPTRIWVINNDETIIATDQDINRAEIGTQTTNQLVRDVLSLETPFASEAVDPTSMESYYRVAIPIRSINENEVIGVVAIDAVMSQIYTENREIIDLFIQSAVLAVIVALVTAFVLSQGLIRPIENIRQQAIRIAEGVYDYPAEVLGHDELGELTLTINELAEKVRDAQESTESERQRLDGVLRHMRDGVIGTDRRGNIMLVNERALYLLNVSQKSVIGRSILDVLKINNQYQINDLMLEDIEIIIEQSTGSIMSLLRAEFSVIRRETGFVTGLVCVLTDVTEQEKTEQERRDFVSNVSHELRTPLTSVKSYSDALIDGAWKDPEIAPHFLEVIQLESNRMIRMVNNLLDLSKMDGGQIILRKDYIDLKRALNHILDRLAFTLKDRGETHHFKRIYTPRDVYVEVDQDRLTQVIENILNNAIKYSPDGGVITVRLVEDNQSVLLSISDEGLGISPTDLEHLFERFYRVDEARSRMQGGSGLGLAISKEVIELHGGRIWVESEINHGSTFTIQLPMTELSDFDEWEDV